MNMSSQPTVLIVATMDTKGNEVQYLSTVLQACGVHVITLDAGIMGDATFPVTINRYEVAMAAGKNLSEVRAMASEGEALLVMTAGATKLALNLFNEKKIDGIMGLGGSMGTTLGTGVMRALPIGFPKLMISTMASKNTRPFVGTKDIMMLHAVCDLSGINRITRKLLWNGGLAMAGMVKQGIQPSGDEKPLVFVTTLGTTEACAQRIKKYLEDKGKEVIIFHTVGSGGESMETIIHEVEVEAVLDFSLHELVDHYFGGDYDAGPDRGSASLNKGIPTLIAPGNIDFIVAGPFAQAEKKFPGRLYHVHNQAITTIRTDIREIASIAQRLVTFSNAATGPVAILVPMKGFSIWDNPGGPFYNPEGPKVFADILEAGLKSDISLYRLPYNINDPEFADEAITILERITHS